MSAPFKPGDIVVHNGRTWTEGRRGVIVYMPETKSEDKPSEEDIVVHFFDFNYGDTRDKNGHFVYKGEFRLESKLERALK